MSLRNVNNFKLYANIQTGIQNIGTHTYKQITAPLTAPVKYTKLTPSKQTTIH